MISRVLPTLRSAAARILPINDDKASRSSISGDTPSGGIPAPPAPAVTRRDNVLAQGPEALADDADRDDRAQDDGPDWPTGCFDDG